MTVLNPLSRLLVAITLVVASASCGGGESSLVGPCIVNFRGPALFVADARDSVSGAAVPSVRLSAITIDGMALDVAALQPVASNVRIVGNALECTVPCGFSSQEGTYVFVASSAGFADTTVRATGSYASREGNCPGTLSDGSNVTVVLTPS